RSGQGRPAAAIAIERDHGDSTQWRIVGDRTPPIRRSPLNVSQRDWKGLTMRRLAVIVAACWCLSALDATAQTKASSLATLFEDIYGPNGLVLSSDDVQLDGTNHAAHFNSAFQSEFRLVNIALTSQLASIPLPSPASGFTYRFDPATGTFVRSTRSFGPILTERGETIGRGRLAFGFSYQFLSFDHLD